MSYKVRLDVFEGPFDLLVYLIERSGLSIYDVNISEITGQYMEYVSELKRVDPESAAEFMVLAATLVQIKSRMLLPRPAVSDEGTEEEADPRDELAQRIAEYKRIKYLAARLSACGEAGARVFAKPREDMSSYAPVERLDIDADRFIEAFKAFLGKRRRAEDVRRRYQRVERERMTIEMKSERIAYRLRGAGTLEFTELIDDADDIYDIVLTFVTILEMLKLGMVSAGQDEIFGNIYITGETAVESDTGKQETYN